LFSPGIGGPGLKTPPAEQLMLVEIGAAIINSSPICAEFAARLALILGLLPIELNATICSGVVDSQKCHFFSFVFKALTAEGFLSN
jgi:hypothetical protein